MSPSSSNPSLRRRPGHSPRRSSRSCVSLPPSVDNIDIADSGPIQSLVSLRHLILSYISDLEAHLTDLEPPDLEAWLARREQSIQDGSEWIGATLEILDELRADVSAQLPDIPIPSFVPNVRSKIDHVRTAFHELDFSAPLSYIPELSNRISDLQSHLSSVDLPSIPSCADISEFLDEILTDIRNAAPDIHEGEEMIEKAAKDISNAIKRSLDGVRLINYSELPQPWRNNPFVVHGYRFIPLERWPLIIMSLFAFHNETLNIHTHLIPFVLWTAHSFPYINPSALADTAETLFMTFALLCLLCSAIWHTMAGCAHVASMEFCARIDYVGIGWLISASVGTVVYYGFPCHPEYRNAFLVLCFITGLAGNILPFMKWFNEYEYRGWRVAFFLTLAFSSVAPMAAIAYFHSARAMFSFIAPIIPSLVSYIVGLVFYITHIPERWLPERWCKKLDVIGGGSHCIWHCFIVLAVYQHKAAIKILRDGIECGST